MALRRTVSKPLLCAGDAALKVRPQVLGWLHGEFIDGIWRVVSGLRLALRRRRGTSELQGILLAASRRVRCFGIVISMLSFLVVVLLWLVAVCLLWILSLLLTMINGSSPWLLEVALEALTFKFVLQTVFFIVPNFTVMFLRYWAYEDQEKVFIAALQQEQLASTDTDREHLAQLAGALQILPAETTWAWLKKYIRRVVRGCRDAILLLAVSAVPRVGPIVYPVALFFRRGKSVGFVPVLILMAISLLPDLPGVASGRMLASWGMQLILTARSTSKELLYTFYSRASIGQKLSLHSQHHARITGFGIAATAVLSIPVVGPLMWFEVVRLAAEVLGSVAILEAKAVFVFQPAVEQFRVEEARKFMQLLELPLELDEKERCARQRRVRGDGQIPRSPSM